jgi:hypothetical protein
MLLPGTITEQNWEEFELAPVALLEQVGHLLVHAEGRVEEVGGDQTDGATAFAQNLPYSGIPVDPSLDLSVIPNLQNAESSQVAQMRKQPVLPLFVVAVAVADEDDRRLVAWLGQSVELDGHG